MGYSQAQKIESRERILDITAKQIKEHGLDSVAIADVMKQAGLTQGAFYGHFASRDELLLEATKKAKENPKRILDDLAAKKKKVTLSDIIDTYLGESHINNPGTGCVVCSLAGEAKIAPVSIKTELSDNFQSQVDFIAKHLGGKSAQARAVGILSALVGAVSLARALNDPDMIEAMLKETKKLILDASRHF